MPCSVKSQAYLAAQFQSRILALLSPQIYRPTLLCSMDSWGFGTGKLNAWTSQRLSHCCTQQVRNHEQLQKALCYDEQTRQPNHTLSKRVGKTSDVSDDASRVPFLALASTKTFRTWNITTIDENERRIRSCMPASSWAGCSVQALLEACLIRIS